MAPPTSAAGDRGRRALRSARSALRSAWTTRTAARLDAPLARAGLGELGARREDDFVANEARVDRRKPKIPSVSAGRISENEGARPPSRRTRHVGQEAEAISEHVLKVDERPMTNVGALTPTRAAPIAASSTQGRAARRGDETEAPAPSASWTKSAASPSSIDRGARWATRSTTPACGRSPRTRGSRWTWPIDAQLACSAIARRAGDRAAGRGG